MKYKIIKMVDDTITFTEEELTKLLDEVYNEGYADGSRSRYYYWSSPTTVPTNPITNPTITWDVTTSGNPCYDGGKVTSTDCELK